MYSLNEYKAIYQNLTNMLVGIQPNWSEKRKVTEIYKRICSNIKCDFEAQEKGLDKVEPFNNRIRKMTGALLDGKCVCKGFANTLKEACALFGINAIMVDGHVKNESHSWNKIQVDGIWYNFDATWDSQNYEEGLESKYAFKTDEELEHDGEYSRTDISGPQCTTKYKESIFTRIKNWFQNFRAKKNMLALPAAEQKTINTEKTNPWDLKNYGMTREEYYEKTENNINLGNTASRQEDLNNNSLGR